MPQDLWQMPMTIEWDWAEMTSFGTFNDPSAAPVLAGGDGLYDAVYNNTNATNNMDGFAGNGVGNVPPQGTAT